MAKIKRALYGLPVMRFYREMRTSQLSRAHRDHSEGFRFAGSDLFFLPNWERQERAVIKEQLKKADVFIDAGANQGFYACLAASSGCPVAAIEPERGNLKFLMSNARENAFKNFEIYPMAASNASGIMAIYGDGDMASSVEGWQNVSRRFVQHVACNTLDNLFSTRWVSKKIFIKVDVEGAEMALIEGSRALCSRHPQPNWLIESFPIQQDQGRTPNKDFHKLFETMADHGYICTRVDTGSPFDPSTAKSWMNDSKAEGSCNFLFERRHETQSR